MKSVEIREDAKLMKVKRPSKRTHGLVFSLNNSFRPIHILLLLSFDGQIHPLGAGPAIVCEVR
jgi:hypothetical protein